MKNEGLFVSYSKAGPDFLAYKMEKMFTRIETPEQMALHNDILADVLAMLDEGEKEGFFRKLAEKILYPKQVRDIYKKKRLLFRLAEQIINQKG